MNRAQNWYDYDDGFSILERILELMSGEEAESEFAEEKVFANCSEFRLKVELRTQNLGVKYD